MFTDGLSIPFFSIGRQVHSRTVSLSATLTTRSRGDAPDWLLWARRPPTSPREPEGSTVISEADVERCAQDAEHASLKEADDLIPGSPVAPKDGNTEEDTHEESSKSTTPKDQADPASIDINQVRCVNRF